MKGKLRKGKMYLGKFSVLDINKKKFHVNRRKFGIKNYSFYYNNYQKAKILGKFNF